MLRRCTDSSVQELISDKLAAEGEPRCPPGEGAMLCILMTQQLPSQLSISAFPHLRDPERTL